MFPKLIPTNFGGVTARVTWGHRMLHLPITLVPCLLHGPGLNDLFITSRVLGDQYKKYQLNYKTLIQMFHRRFEIQSFCFCGNTTISAQRSGLFEWVRQCCSNLRKWIWKNSFKKYNIFFSEERASSNQISNNHVGMHCQRNKTYIFCFLCIASWASCSCLV